MTTTGNPYPIPGQLSPMLRRVMAYWESLKRGGADMPFWDDAKLSDLAELTDQLLLVDVFDKPERFRFNTIGKSFLASSAHSLAGRFADEVELEGALVYLRSQLAATVEARAPTYYHHAGAQDTAAFSRLLLPMWGDGRIGMLLGALDPH